MNRSIALLFTFAAACGASAAPADPGPAASTGGEPAAACPLFCVRIAGGACTHPEGAPVPDSCGHAPDMEAFTPRAACPETCCVPLGATGDDPDFDGIVGAADRCPDVPEDRDGYEDQDGCSDADNDGDGQGDPQDVCCYVAEDMDGVEDLDGCPE